MNFEEVYKINVNEFTETRKNGSKELTYLSWAYAVKEFKKIYPDMTYEIKKFKNDKGVEVPYMYDENTGYMVMTSVTANGETYEMWLPVMDGSNKAMKSKPYTYTVKDFYGKEIEKSVNQATMFDINKTIMRCLTKNFAMFGLGLYIYAGEDLPEKEEAPEQQLSSDVINKVNGFTSVDELKAYYTEVKDSIPTALKKDFNTLVSNKKMELENGKNN